MRHLDKRTSSQTYNWLSRQFHWFIAVLIFINFALGWTMTSLELSKETLNFFSWHKWIGIIILGLVLVRLIWRFVSKVPSGQAPDVPAFFRFGAKFGHVALYFLLIVLPLIGWLRSSTAGFQVVLFETFPLPNLLAKNETLSKQLSEIHELLALLLAFLIVAHIAAVIVHHIFLKDPVLLKMKPNLLHIVLIVVTLIGGAGFYGTYHFYLSSQPQLTYDGDMGSESHAGKQAKIDEKTIVVRGEGQQWIVDYNKSKFEFVAKQNSAETIGEFKEYLLKQLRFDPTKLNEAVVEIEIDVSSITLGNLMIEQTLGSSQWFDVSDFPKAYFVSNTFKKVGIDLYELTGDLKIKDIVKSEILTLSIKTSSVLTSSSLSIEAEGQAVISRLDYKIGQGEWADTGDLDENVILKFHIHAIKRR